MSTRGRKALAEEPDQRRARLRIVRKTIGPYFVSVVLEPYVREAIRNVASGYAVYNELGGDWLEEVHEVVGNAMLVLVGVHLAGVAVASYLHRENLPRAMVTGVKQGQPSQGIARAWWSVALVLLLAVAAFWYQEWRDAPQVRVQDAAQSSSASQ